MFTESHSLPDARDKPTPSPTPEPYPYKGFPKVVPRTEVPVQMRYYIHGPKAVALAPGVWTQYIPGVTPEESARTGAMIGYCAAVEKANEELENESGYTSW